MVFIHAQSEHAPSTHEWVKIVYRACPLGYCYYSRSFVFSVRVIEVGDGDTKPFLYRTPTAFLKTALLIPGNSLLISDGGDLSPMGSVPPTLNLRRSNICTLTSSAFAFPPNGRRLRSSFPSSSLHRLGQRMKSEFDNHHKLYLRRVSTYRVFNTYASSISPRTTSILPLDCRK